MVAVTICYVGLLAIFALLADLGALRSVLRELHQIPLADKVVHFSVTAMLTLLVSLSLRRVLPGVRAVAIAALLVLMVATLEECTNLVIAVRNWSLGDLAANYLGVVCMGMGLLVVHGPGSLWLRSGQNADG